MTNLTLLVMAAGSGARYGRLKQIDPLGPAGETLVDYSIFDAMRFGFDKVVFIIRRDMEDVFREAVGARIEKSLEVSYVFQGEAAAAVCPAGLQRKKPWGTAHALLSAIDVIHEPFAVINADDYYGYQSFQIIGEHLHSGSEDSALVGFRLRNTLSDFGPVKRGLCKVADDVLQGVAEVDIESSGRQVDLVDSDGVRHPLTGDETVSMNVWGFQPTIFPVFQDAWLKFLHESGSSEKSEFYIPSVIGNFVSSGDGICRVLPTPSRWFGITYPDDRPIAIRRLKELISQGVYPDILW